MLAEKEVPARLLSALAEGQEAQCCLLPSRQAVLTTRSTCRHAAVVDRVTAAGRTGSVRSRRGFPSMSSDLRYPETSLATRCGLPAPLATWLDLAHQQIH